MRNKTPYTRKLPRPRLRPLVLAFGLAAFGMYVAAGSVQQKPITQHRVHVDGGPGVPDTLSKLWGMTELVVLGHVSSIEPADQVITTIQGGAPITIIKTRYTFDVLENFKSPPTMVPPSSIVVERMGGTRDRGTHVDDYVDDEFPAFKQKHRYVLFLRKLPGSDTYVPVTAGPDSVVLFTEAGVFPFGKGHVARVFATMSPESLIAALRQEKGGRQ